MARLGQRPKVALNDNPSPDEVFDPGRPGSRRLRRWRQRQCICSPMQRYRLPPPRRWRPTTAVHALPRRQAGGRLGGHGETLTRVLFVCQGTRYRVVVVAGRTQPSPLRATSGGSSARSLRAFRSLSK
jgi:hypothetical protein